MFPIRPLSAFIQDHSEILLSSGYYNISNTTCLEDNPILWAYTVFHECIYNVKEEIGLCLGLISILCWICASLPQLYENYRNGRVDEAISFWFLLFWLFGDSSNLIGCLLTGQLPIQLYTAVYYVSMDILMIFQFLYYFFKHRRAQTAYRGIINDLMTAPTSSRNERIICCLCFSVFLSFLFIPQDLHIALSDTSNNRNGRMLLSVGKNWPHRPIAWTTMNIIGYAMGCLSSVFYLGSRLPQVIKNYRRQATEGVSQVMFILAVAGNTLYGTSILLQDPQLGHTYGQFIVFHLPWLIGSIGTLGLDFTVLNQIWYYSHNCCCRRRRKRVQTVGLLNGSLSEDDEILA